jgi:hypothetical protein
MADGWPGGGISLGGRPSSAACVSVESLVQEARPGEARHGEDGAGDHDHGGRQGLGHGPDRQRQLTGGAEDPDDEQQGPQRDTDVSIDVADVRFECHATTSLGPILKRGGRYRAFRHAFYRRSG